MRKALKFLAAAVVAILPIGGSGTARAAQACPPECRREWTETICTRTEIERDGRTIVIATFWSNGVE